MNSQALVIVNAGPNGSEGVDFGAAVELGLFSAAGGYAKRDGAATDGGW